MLSGRYEELFYHHQNVLPYKKIEISIAKNMFMYYPLPFCDGGIDDITC